MNLNQIGILLNLIDAILLYYNGLPSKIQKENYLRINTGILEQEDIDDKIKGEFILIKSTLGIAFVIVGTFFQFWETL